MNSPALLVQRHVEAIAHGDVAAAFALYDDDAVLQGGSCARQHRVLARARSRRSSSTAWRLKTAPRLFANTCLVTSRRFSSSYELTRSRKPA